MAPYPEISSFPPLGQLTVLSYLPDEVDFTVCIEWHKVRPQYMFEVDLCYTDASSNLHRGRWATTALRRADKLPLLVRHSNDEYQRVSYVGSLDISSIPAAAAATMKHVVFTLKYRVDSISAWKWIEIPGGISTGELLLSNLHGEAAFDLPQLENSWKRMPLKLGNGAVAHELVSPTMIPKGEYQQTELPSKILQNIISAPRYMALTRLEPYWLGVIQDKGQFYTAEDALVICYLTPTGRSVALLALNPCDDTYTVFRSGSKGEVLVCSRSDGEAVPFRCFEAISGSPHEAISTVIAAARKRRSESSGKLGAFHEQAGQSPVSVADGLFFDSFSFCTWNALGQDLTLAKLMNGLERLSSAGINISTLLIDDNWQTIGRTSLEDSNSFYRGFAEFPPNEKIGSFADLIPLIRAKYPRIKHIGVWHALLGYWGGLATNGILAKHYETRVVKSKLMGNVPAEITIVDPSDIHRFFNDFYSYLTSQGIDFVKTDVQHMLDMFSSLGDRRDCVTAYQAAWTSAYLKHFYGQAISCMSMIPEILFHSVLQDRTPKILYRNSDDFYPEIPASHPWHVWVNAHNALLTEHLNVVPDWDMFQTSHPYSSYHAAARCISGGPIMITDVPGEHDLDLIKQIVAESPDGRTVAIRPNIAKTMGVWDRYADGNILKIGTTAGPRAQYGMIGLFNIAEKEKHAIVPIGEFPGVEEGAQVLVRSYRTGQIFGPLDVKKDQSKFGVQDLVQVKLEVRGWEILTAYPVRQLRTAAGRQAQVAVFGLMEKMSGAAAVTRCEVQDAAKGSMIKIGLKALGKLGIWYKGPRLDSVAINVEGRAVDSKDQVWSYICEEVMLGSVDVLRFGREKNMWVDQKEATVELLL